MIATVENLVQQLLIIKKIKLNVSIEVPKENFSLRKNY
jgi:hypothetical protein